MRIRGTTLHVEQSGTAKAPALLYVHGGPGQGGYDFTCAQADLLTPELHLIVVDQRGALRSDALTPGETVSIATLVADFEAVRQELYLGPWVVIGHSFGARIALHYALEHSAAVAGVAFESPDWDSALSTRTHLTAALPLLDAIGRHRAAARARQLLASPPPAGPQTWRARRSVLAALGNRRLELYVHQPDVRRRLATTGFPSDALPEEWRQRGARQAVTLTADPQTHRPLLPRLAELRQPALLLYGDHDPLAVPEVLDAFATVDRGRVERFADTGHFLHLEQPQRYATIVSEFVRSCAVKSAAPRGNTCTERPDDTAMSTSGKSNWPYQPDQGPDTGEA